jgi:hypothetical protein
VIVDFSPDAKEKPASGTAVMTTSNITISREAVQQQRQFAAGEFESACERPKHQYQKDISACGNLNLQIKHSWEHYCGWLPPEIQASMSNENAPAPSF